MASRAAATETHLRNTPSERRLRRPGQVSWLAGRCGTVRPSQRQRRQWTMDGELAAYSCGGSFGFGAGRLTEFPLSSEAIRRTSITVTL